MASTIHSAHLFDEEQLRTLERELSETDWKAIVSSTREAFEQNIAQVRAAASDPEQSLDEELHGFAGDARSIAATVLFQRIEQGRSELGAGRLDHDQLLADLVELSEQVCSALERSFLDA